MNIIRKIYCRVFQQVFHAAIPILPYRTPKFLHSVADIPAELRERGILRVLVVTDGFLSKSGALAPLLDALSAGGITAFLYDEVIPNPTISNVESAREVYLKNGCEALIGFGGGSSIDCAKGVGARIARKNKPLQKMRGILKVLKKPPLTIAIPTTAGTGSETTVTVVVTDEKTHEKYPISDLVLIPDIAVLDAEVTRTLPPNITAATGMDALTHAIEAYIGRSTVKSTREAAQKTVKLIFENIEKVYRDGNDMTARKNMLIAAFWGGYAFSKSYVGYCHAVAHTLGGRYGIPHGIANAVLIPYVLEAYGEAAYKALRDLAVAGGLCGEDEPVGSAAKLFIQKVRDLNREMGIPEKLSGICEADIPELARLAEREANPLYPVPVLMTAQELSRFYYEVAEDLK